MKPFVFTDVEIYLRVTQSILGDIMFYIEKFKVSILHLNRDWNHWKEYSQWLIILPALECLMIFTVSFAKPVAVITMEPFGFVMTKWVGDFLLRVYQVALDAKGVFTSDGCPLFRQGFW